MAKKHHLHITPLMIISLLKTRTLKKETKKTNIIPGYVEGK